MENKEKSFDIKSMSDATGIPIGTLITSLGIDPESVYWYDMGLNPEKLASLANLMPDNSSARNRIIAQRDRLLLQSAKDAKTLSDAVQALLASPSESDAANQAFTKMLTFIKTSAEAWEIATGHVIHRLNHEQQRKVFEKWLFIFNEFDDGMLRAMARLRIFRNGDPLKYLLVEKLLRLATVPEQAASLLFHRYISDDDTTYANMCEERWDELSHRDIESSSTLEAANEAKNQCRPDSAIEQKAIKKRDELGILRARKARSLDEAETVLCLVSEDSEAASVAREKRETFAFARIAAAKTFSKAKAAYEAVRRCSGGVRSMALDNVLAQAGDSEEMLKEVYVLACRQSRDRDAAQKQVIRKLAECHGWKPKSEV